MHVLTELPHLEEDHNDLELDEKNEEDVEISYSEPQGFDPGCLPETKSLKNKKQTGTFLKLNCLLEYS